MTNRKPQNWQEVRLGDIVKIYGGNSPSAFNLLPEGKYPYLKVEDLNNCRILQKKSRNYSNDEHSLVPSDSIIFPKRGAAIMNNKIRVVAVPAQMDSNLMAVHPNEKIVNYKFLFYKIFNEKLSRIADTSTIPQINNKHINPYKILLPPLPEQEKIVLVLETWDSSLEKLSKTIKLKKKLKKGLRHKLLSGKVRLPGFIEPWETKEIEELLDYEQPTNYIVQSTEYSNEYETPVLTAGKTFVLGKTNETTGIYDKVPVIIFDDFTTANKFVTFPFKVKSSAMKILKAKNNADLKFVYEIMQIIKFPVGEHKRNYLSEYQYLSIDIPSLPEQSAIAYILTTADQEIEALEKKRKLVEAQKKFLLNNLVTGKIRLPEFIN